MNSSFFGRMPEWRNLVWIGVIGSVVAWALVWFMTGGWSMFTVLIALAGVPLALRATRAAREARLELAGLVIVGLTLLVGSVYLSGVTLLDGPLTIVNMVALSVLPMVAAVALLLGSVPGFARTRTA